MSIPKALLLALLMCNQFAFGQGVDDIGPLTSREISYQGHISVNGQPYTGTGYFKFILLATNPVNGPITRAAARVTSRNNGVIEEVTVDEAGSGYLSPPTITVTGGGGSGAILKPVSFAQSYTLNRIEIVNGGSGYTSAPTITISGPAPEIEALWSSDNSRVPNSLDEPALAREYPVENGLYSVILGFNPDFWDNTVLRPKLALRVWFSTSEDGPFEQLTPDQPISAVPFSFLTQRIVGPFSNATGFLANAPGYQSLASGDFAMASGDGTTASGLSSTSMGQDTVASGSSSIAMGRSTRASGTYSTATGVETVASGFASFATGSGTEATRAYSVAMGRVTTASADFSTAMGLGTVANSSAETALGQYNTGASGNDRLFVVGNGSSTTTRSDALVVKKDGRSTFIANPPGTSGFFLENYASVFRNTDSGGGDVMALQVSDDNPGNGTNFLAFFDNDGSNNGSGQILGEIDGNAAGGVRFQSSGADYAEYLPPLDADEPMQPGDVVAVRNGHVTRDTSSFDNLMVISSNPIIVGNRPEDLPEDESGYFKVAFIGQVPVKVSGVVRSGDYLVASGRGDGTAVAKAASEIRASDGAFIIGRSWDSSTEEGEKLINAAVGLDNGAALVSEIQSLKKRLKAVEAVLSRQQKSQGQTQTILNR